MSSEAEDLEKILGRECPVCGDTYHDLNGHLLRNYKGCADATREPAE